MNLSLNRYLQDFTGLFYPNLCLTCQRSLIASEKHICTHCQQDLPLADDYTTDKEYIFAGRIPVNFVVSLLRYAKDEKTQTLLHELKYRNNPQIGIFLGHMLGKRIESELMELPGMIIPVPLHKKKKKKRGYNQSEMFANGLSKALGIHVRTDIVLRKSYTETQTHKTRIERWNNVKDAFEVRNFSLNETKHILIVDDVITTGATIEAVAIKLMEKTDAQISVASIAIA